MARSAPRLADFMPYRLSITSNAVSSFIAGKYRAEFGLKIPEWRIMAVLGDLGSQTQRELVAATLMDKVAVNRACKVLEERGLIARRPNERDGRSHHLELTAVGKKTHGEIMPRTVEEYRRVFSCLSRDEEAQLGALLGKLLECVTGLEGGKA